MRQYLGGIILGVLFVLSIVYAFRLEYLKKHPKPKPKNEYEDKWFGLKMWLWIIFVVGMILYVMIFAHIPI